MDDPSWFRDRSARRARDIRTKAIGLIAILFQWAGTAAIGIGGLV
jgi:hypothetical protein